jgi:competence protein ComEA
MDESPSPWRALEAPTSRPGSAEAPPTASGHRLFAAAGFLLAGVLAVFAFAMASSAPTGNLVVNDALAATHAPVVGSGSPASPTGAAQAEVVIEVVGAVERPGVYRLGMGARVGDAVIAAGGYGPRVDADRASRELNLAQPLVDGIQIRVPSRDDPSLPPVAASVAPAGAGTGAGGGTGGSDLGSGGPIDLNTATSAELEELPGIGPVTAAKIIAAREEQPFTNVTELESRDVLGPATYEKVRELVTVR